MLGCVPVQVGDGTTTVVILSGELLRAAKPFVEEGVHPRVRAGAAASGSVLVYVSMRHHTARCNRRPLHPPHEAVASRCSSHACFARPALMHPCASVASAAPAEHHPQLPPGLCPCCVQGEGAVSQPGGQVGRGEEGPAGQVRSNKPQLKAGEAAACAALLLQPC